MLVRVANVIVASEEDFLDSAEDVRFFQLVHGGMAFGCQAVDKPGIGALPHVP